MANAGLEFNVAEALGKIFDDYQKALGISLERALDKCADAYIAQLEKTAPRWVRGDTAGKPYHQSFEQRKGELGNVVYVGNTKTVSSKKHPTIPLINLLEYGRRTKNGDSVGARPHMTDALIATADTLQKIVEDEIERMK